MNQARITLKCEIIAVEVPDTANYFTPYTNSLDIWVDPEEAPITIYIPGLKLEDRELGRFTELSEEQCARLVDAPYPSFYSGPYWAKDELKEKLKANNINPDKALIIKVNH